MRLAHRATGILKGLKSKQPGDRHADGLEKNEARSLKAREKGRAAQLKSKDTSRYPRRTAGKAIATALGKRHRNMGHPAIAIHEDAHDTNLQSRRLRKMSAHDPTQDDTSVQDESMSDDSDCDDDPKESVMEEMRKLEESFAGISQKYRLINRIGEGLQELETCWQLANLSQALSLPSTRPNSCPRMKRRTLRTDRWTISLKMHLHRNDES
jgi:hypothetical protein